MDFAFRPEHEDFRRELGAWLASHVKRPWAQECSDPNLDADALVEVRRHFQRALNDAGYLGMDWPEEWGGRGATVVDADESPRRDSTLEALGKLRPAFRSDAPSEIDDLVVTAGNAPGLNDGAAALVVCSQEFATAHGLEVEAVISDYAVGATEPQDLFFAPIHAVQKLMAREERAVGVDVTFEVRLTGEGGGVWTVRIHDGACDVQRGFARRADVRYTADARAWCGLALGLTDAREMMNGGLLVKEGGREAMDHYFHQVGRPGREASSPAPDPEAKQEENMP